jgi:hypothetical protein
MLMFVKRFKLVINDINLVVNLLNLLVVIAVYVPNLAADPINSMVNISDLLPGLKNHLTKLWQSDNKRKDSYRPAYNWLF